MDFFVEPLTIADVEAGRAGDEARYLFSFWQTNKGFMEHDRTMTRLSRKLIITRAHTGARDVPEITFIGKDSTFQRFFPECSRSSAPSKLLPEGYRQRVANGYGAAIAGEPHYDIQRTGGLLGEGRPDLTLERLILPFRTRAGLQRLFCLMILRDLRQQFCLSDRTDHPPYSRHGSDCGPGFSARVHSSATHRNARA